MSRSELKKGVDDSIGGVTVPEGRAVGLGIVLQETAKGGFYFLGIGSSKDGSPTVFYECDGAFGVFA